MMGPIIQPNLILQSDHIVCLREVLWVAPFNSEFPEDSAVYFKNGEHITLKIGREELHKSIKYKHHYALIDDYLICIDEIQWVAPAEDPTLSVIHFKNGRHIVIRATRKEICDQLPVVQ